MTRKTHISIKHISKVFPDGTRALHDINLDIAEGEILVLLGPQAVGKAPCSGPLAASSRSPVATSTSTTKKSPRYLWKTVMWALCSKITPLPHHDSAGKHRLWLETPKRQSGNQAAGWTASGNDGTGGNADKSPASSLRGSSSV